MLHRQSGHRPKREIQDIRASEVAELRSENQRLRRENARLRRENQRLPPVEEEPVSLAEANEPVTKSLIKCPKCNGGVLTLSMNDKNYLVCKDCKWRKVDQ